MTMFKAYKITVYPDLTAAFTRSQSIRSWKETVPNLRVAKIKASRLSDNSNVVVIEQAKSGQRESIKYNGVWFGPYEPNKAKIKRYTT